MDFVYDRSVAAPTTTVWAVLTDPAAMEPHLPGTAKVVSMGPNAYRVSMKISMGFLRPTVNADVHLTNVDQPRSFSITLSGKSMGAGVSGTADVTLIEDGGKQAGTHVGMTGSVETSGLLKKVPDSKIEAAVKGFLESYFTSVENAVATS